jgi:hypothetical protein
MYDHPNQSSKNKAAFLQILITFYTLSSNQRITKRWNVAQQSDELLLAGGATLFESGVEHYPFAQNVTIYFFAET